MAEVLSLDIHGRVKKAATDQGDYFGKTVVLSMGAKPRKLGLPEEQGIVGRGVNYCAACDGVFINDAKSSSGTRFC